MREGNPTVMGFLFVPKSTLNLDLLGAQVHQEFGEDAHLELREELLLDDKLLMITLHLGSTTLLCTHMPFPMSGAEQETVLEQLSEKSPLYELVRGHGSFLIVSTINQDPDRRMGVCYVFQRFCALLMGLSGACAIYLSGTKLLLSSRDYCGQVELAKRMGQGRGAYFPTPLWIGVELPAEGRLARTLGMADFGRCELCLPASHLDRQEAVERLHSLCMQELISPGGTDSSGQRHTDRSSGVSS